MLVKKIGALFKERKKVGDKYEAILTIFFF